jgi:hypothetical protein
MSRTPTRTLDLDPIDRLEEKVKLLVAMIAKLKADQARSAEENLKLRRDLEAARASRSRFGGSDTRSAARSRRVTCTIWRPTSTKR